MDLSFKPLPLKFKKPLKMKPSFFKISICFIVLISIFGCKSETQSTEKNKLVFELEEKLLDDKLPIIGVVIYDKFLTNEIVAPLDVFGKHNKDNNKMFNVISIAKSIKPYTSEEGLKMIPDYTIENSPQLDVIVVPSSYDIEGALKNKEIIEFIKKQNEHTKYTTSHCAGAYLLGASGVVDGKKVVTYIGGQGLLQETYPEVQVQNDSIYSFIEDGKFITSNGNLVSYIASLELLEKMTNRVHREYVEEQLYISRLRNYSK